MECEHDYEHPVRKGRANLRCPKCDADITLMLVFMYEARINSQPGKPYHEIDHDHCWNQGKEPACGLPKSGHEICCLCAIPKKGKRCRFGHVTTKSFCGGCKLDKK